MPEERALWNNRAIIAKSTIGGVHICRSTGLQSRKYKHWRGLKSPAPNKTCGSPNSDLTRLLNYANACTRGSCRVKSLVYIRFPMLNRFEVFGRELVIAEDADAVYTSGTESFEVGR